MNITQLFSTIDRHKLSEILLRAAVAIAFMYPAIDASFNPSSWIGFFPTWMRELSPSDGLLLHAFGATEIAIALWILFARHIFIPSVLASVYLVAIVLFNWQFIDLLFRDVSILGISLALALKHYRKEDLDNLKWSSWRRKLQA